ncbi:MAG: hypothetical protein ACTHJ2_09645 [Candidatus Nitrosocosmicus sp.]
MKREWIIAIIVGSLLGLFLTGCSAGCTGTMCSPCDPRCKIVGNSPWDPRVSECKEACDICDECLASIPCGQDKLNKREQ